jgi:hypothetical protein
MNDQSSPYQLLPRSIRWSVPLSNSNSHYHPPRQMQGAALWCPWLGPLCRRCSWIGDCPLMRAEGWLGSGFGSHRLPIWTNPLPHTEPKMESKTKPVTGRFPLPKKVKIPWNKGKVMMGPLVRRIGKLDIELRNLWEYQGDEPRWL